MKAKTTVIAFSFLMVVSTFMMIFYAGQASPASSGTLYSESFETGLADWKADHHLVNETLDWPLEWHFKINDTYSFNGTSSVEAYLNGDHEEGTIWLEHSFQTLKSIEVEIKLSFHLFTHIYSDITSWPVLGYIGLDNPETTSEFEVLNPDENVDIWWYYSLTKTITTDETGLIWVAFGYGATWDSERTYFFDLVELSYPDEVKLGPPLSITPNSTTDQQPIITWSAPDGFNNEDLNYFIQIGNTSGGDELLQWTSTGSNNSYEVRTELEPETYYVQVRAFYGKEYSSTAEIVMEVDYDKHDDDKKDGSETQDRFVCSSVFIMLMIVGLWGVSIIRN
jgi:hypothetical protein